MTVSYTAEVANSRNFGVFLKLLARWRASIYKLIWKELLLFLVLYYGLSLLYRFVLNDQQKNVFESIVFYCNENVSLIPLSFVLGFYVSVVMQRWWDQYMAIPWPDPIAVYVSALVRGQDEHGRIMRRTIMRYVCLCQTMMLTMISPNVKKRFPTFAHMIEAGLMVESEREVLLRISEKFPKHPVHWMPIVWAASIVTRARKEGRIWDDFSLRTIIDELNKFRGNCGALLHFDWISIPLVYTQVVTLAVYSYFLGAVFGNQWTEKRDMQGFFNVVDYYIPVFATLQFFFFMGWLKVAESLTNPFGPDDDDFEVNWMIDRNLQVSYLIVDEMHHEHPVLVRDQYWDDIFPNQLPYPNESTLIREQPPVYSTAKLDINKANAESNVLSNVKVDGINRGIFVSSLHANWSRWNVPIWSFLTRSRVRLNDATSSSSHVEEEKGVSMVVFEQNSEEGKEVVTTGPSFAPPASAPTAPPRPQEKDEFELLREERERERLHRQRQLLRRVGHTPLLTPSQSASRRDSHGHVPRDRSTDKDKDKDQK